MARETGLEPATSTVTGWYSNQLSYSPAFAALVTTFFKISPFYRFSNRIQQKIADFQVFCPNRRLLPVRKGKGGVWNLFSAYYWNAACIARITVIC